MRIVFFGTPPFAARILQYLLKNGIDVVAVVTRTDKPKGRSGKPQPPAVKEIAQQQAQNLPIYQPKKASDPEFVDILAKHKPDLGIVVAYGEIMKQNLLDLPLHGCINVHASLLPEYRGAAPIQRSIMDGKKETGISIMEMVLALDAGSVIAQSKTRITENMTCGELHDKLCDLSCPLLLDVIQKIERGEAASTPQDEALVTYAHKISQAGCRIDWRRSADAVHDLIRGVSPVPGAWCEAIAGGSRKRMKIYQSTTDYRISGKPGEVVRLAEGGLSVACGDGGIRILELQLEGKKRMTVDAFLRGQFLIECLQ